MATRGWLVNPERRERRDRAHTFTDRDVQHLITAIEKTSEYVSSTLGPEFDRLVRLRDKALIATAWTWFKRAGEVLGVKRKDVALTERDVFYKSGMSYKVRLVDAVRY